MIISNCVIHLSPEKDRVLTEAWRVLKPGGRFVVSHIVVRGTVSADIRQSIDLWMGCVTGAMEEDEYQERLIKAGFESIELIPTRIYGLEDAQDFLSSAGLNFNEIAPKMNDRFMSAFIRARKPEECEIAQTKEMEWNAHWI